MRATWDQAWTIADHIERIALSLVSEGGSAADTHSAARADLIAQAAALNRLGLRLVSEAIDRAVQP